MNDWIYIHEKRAKKAAVSVYITTGIALLGLIIGFKLWKFQYVIAIICVICIIVSLLLTAWTSDTGGKIHHSEFRQVQQ